jgi:uncharacterized membrane protein YkvA (DUF1232 family)
VLNRLKARARELKREVYAIYLAARDPRTPWYAKALAFFVVAHTFNPIDLIPDFIPVLGYLDDLIITPGGLWLAVRLIPPEVLEDPRAMATAHDVDRRVGKVRAVLIVCYGSSPQRLSSFFSCALQKEYNKLRRLP